MKTRTNFLTGLTGVSPSPDHDEILEDAEQPDDEPQVPEWLYRIRQRAQTEPDSIGEITQKINAARASLETAQRGSGAAVAIGFAENSGEVEKPPDQVPDETRIRRRSALLALCTKIGSGASERSIARLKLRMQRSTLQKGKAIACCTGWLRWKTANKQWKSCGRGSC